MRTVLVVNLLLIALVACSGYSQADTEYQQAIGLIHMDSEVSGGSNSLGMLAAVAKNAGADMAIVTDHDTQKATYGIWPLQKLLRVSHSRASVFNFGVKAYLDEIAFVDNDLKDFDYLPGIEAVPYYHWARDPFNNTLSLKNLHRHMLVMGLDSAEQIKNLPSIESGFPMKYTRMSLLGLVWFIPLFISFVLFKPADSRHSYYSHWFFALFSNQINMISMPLMVVSIVFLVNNYPFKAAIVDQYAADAKALPYQTVIDYVRSQGGLIFWAHPEAMYEQEIGLDQKNPFLDSALKSIFNNGLEVKTDPYYTLLNETFDYTGFAIFFEGYKVVGKPEGLWDNLLTQYCLGNRDRPMWAISELDMEEGTDPKTASVSQNVLLVKEKTKEEYLEALRVGRVHCFTSDLTKWVTINDYSIYSDGVRAVSGEMLEYKPDAELVFDIDIRKHDLNFNVVVIQNNQVHSSHEISSSSRLTIPLSEPENDMGYVRIALFMGSIMKIATNPIFYLK